MHCVREVGADEPGLLPALAEVLRDSVHGGASIGFLAPVSQATATRYWEEILGGLGGSLRLWVAEDEGSIVGTVQIAPCQKENGRHRADLQKLLVHSAHRRRGIATALMATAETAAAQSGLSLLVLDTLRGTDAERLYVQRGWQRAGEIPGYAATPDGVLHPTVYFFKSIGAQARVGG